MISIENRFLLRQNPFCSGKTLFAPTKPFLLRCFCSAVCSYDLFLLCAFCSRHNFCSGKTTFCCALFALDTIFALAKPRFAPAKLCFAPAKPCFAPAKPCFAPAKPCFAPGTGCVGRVDGCSNAAAAVAACGRRGCPHAPAPSLSRPRVPQRLGCG